MGRLDFNSDGEQKETEKNTDNLKINLHNEENKTEIDQFYINIKLHVKNDYGNINFNENNEFTREMCEKLFKNFVKYTCKEEGIQASLITTIEKGSASFFQHY